VKGIPVDEEGMTLAETDNAAAHYLYFAVTSISAGLCDECCPSFAVAGGGPRSGSWIIEDDYDSEFRYPAIRYLPCWE
jgi:GntR family transcriptional regulator/MocR family aminotransferase